MMRKILVFLGILANSGLFAQVGIGTVTPEPSSQLDISATNKGVLVPRISLDNVANTMIDGANTAATGLLIYNTNAVTVGGSGTGYYYFNGSVWERLTTSSNSSADADWFEVGTTTPPDAITDDIYTQGNVAIGKTTADYPLDIESDISERGVNLQLMGTDGAERRGVYTTITNSGNGFHFGTYNLLSGVGSGAHNGIYNLLSGAGTGDMRGTYNYVNNSGNGEHFGVLNTLLGSGSGVHQGINNLIFGSGTGTHYGVLNELSSSGSGFHYGVENRLSGAGTGQQYGIFNRLSNTGDNVHYGIYNELTGNGSGLHYGMRNIMNGTGTGIQNGLANSISSSNDANQIGVSSAMFGSGDGDYFAINNSISNSGNGDHYGVRSSLSGSGTGQKLGIENQLTGSGGGVQYAVKNDITNSGNGIHYGMFAELSGSGSGQHYGTYSELSGTGTGFQYGAYHLIGNSGDANHFGVFNSLFGTGTGIHYGMVNTIGGTGSGAQVGTITLINNSGNGDHRGFSSQLSGNGSGDKTGVDIIVNASAGGTHYGIRSEVTKVGSFAGYFRGAVAIGTNAVNTYTLPASRGAANQVIQTDGSGNLSWVDTDSFVPVLGARNGLNLNGTDIELGGTLSQDTSILLGASDLRFNLGASGNFIIEDTGFDIFEIDNAGNTDVGTDMIWRDGTTTATVLAAIFDDGNDGRFYVAENGAISVDLDANTQFVFNEQGLDRNFRVESDGQTDMFFVDAGTDRIGVREGSPLVDIHLKQSTLGSGTSGGMAFESSTSTDIWKIYHSGIHFSFAENGVRRAYVEGATGNYVITSDRRLKKNIESLPNVANKLHDINLYRYHYISQHNSEKKVLGAMAQEVQSHFPEIVSTDEHGNLGISYDGLSVIAIKAIKEQQAVIETQQSEIDALKKEIKSIKALLKQ
tara:strand:- start:30113 stop:32869 length:2757 start_codon:yes stop_codon:yes gene_type:complete